MGDVVVTGMASAVGDLPPEESPAIPTTDFPSAPVSLAFQDGVTSGFMNLSLPDNTISSSLKVFRFALTSVSATSTSQRSPPRLSSVSTTASVTIVDDEGGSGQFQLSPLALTLAEGASQVFRIVRSGESSGRVSVFVQTVQSGLATAGLDYEPFNEELIFESGVTQLLKTVTIPQDEIPEGPEEFSIVLSAPTSATLINSSAVS
jgi:G-protein coupled receptor 98